MVKALIVEDETALQQLYSRVLQTVGFDVTIAGDGNQAIAKLEQESPPQLIILDVRMPHCNGVEVLEYLQTYPSVENIHVVIATATRSFEAYRTMLPSTDFLLKPVLPRDLQNVAHRLTT